MRVLIEAVLECFLFYDSPSHSMVFLAIFMNIHFDDFLVVWLVLGEKHKQMAWTCFFG